MTAATPTQLRETLAAATQAVEDAAVDIAEMENQLNDRIRDHFATDFALIAAAKQRLTALRDHRDAIRHQTRAGEGATRARVPAVSGTTPLLPPK